MAWLNGRGGPGVRIWDEEEWFIELRENKCGGVRPEESLSHFFENREIGKSYIYGSIKLAKR